LCLWKAASRLMGCCLHIRRMEYGGFWFERVRVGVPLQYVYRFRPSICRPNALSIVLGVSWPL
jgi:hypothetical protein